MANANPSSNSSFFSIGGMLAQPSSLKLDIDNLLLWQNMILQVLRGYKFEGFLTGETPWKNPTSPSVVSGSPTTKKEPNPEYDV